MDLRERQRPLKESYRERPEAALVTLTARGSEGSGAVACSVDLGRMIQDAQAHGASAARARGRAPATCCSEPFPPAPR